MKAALIDQSDPPRNRLGTHFLCTRQYLRRDSNIALPCIFGCLRRRHKVGFTPCLRELNQHGQVYACDDLDLAFNEHGNREIRIMTPLSALTLRTADRISSRRRSISSSGPIQTVAIWVCSPTTCSVARRNSVASCPCVTITSPITACPLRG